MKKLALGLAIAGLLVAPEVAWAQGKQRRASATATPTATPAAAAGAATVRTVKGHMRGNVISIRNVADKPAMEYTITSARVVDGKLELEGTVRPVGRRSGQGAAATATLVGALAMHRPGENFRGDDWEQAAAESAAEPDAAAGQPETQPQGSAPETPETAGQNSQLTQSTQSTARTTQTPTAPGGEQPEKSEGLTEAIVEAPVDTKPLAEGKGVTGCELVFLRLQVPQQMAAAAGGRTVQLNVSLAQIDNKAGINLNQRICRVVRALESKSRAADAEVERLNKMLAATK
jgi:hypothetical protein